MRSVSAMQPRFLDWEILLGPRGLETMHSVRLWCLSRRALAGLLAGAVTLALLLGLALAAALGWGCPC